MKRITLALLGTAALLPVVAWAQSATQTITLNANVPKFCSYASASALAGANNFTGTVGLASSVMTVTNPTSGSGQLNAANFSIVMASVCNSPSKVTLVTQNGAMKTVGPISMTPSSGVFANRIDYIATATWGTGSAALDTSDGGGLGPGASNTGTVVVGPRSANLTVGVTLNNAPTTIVAAGTYTDVLTVMLEPQ